ncbi:hypothetical protein CS022_22635 [Veronia nyctiphanis]|uniref:Uncharacterized protein n=1 Tax=Veronia nyctiphanis TaxID=1278244 RepID=A0A4Q0YJU0_9GAMM|nr:hypothetical protein CS022_22635 [Veronia nyctiphanis]
MIIEEIKIFKNTMNNIVHDIKLEYLGFVREIHLEKFGIPIIEESITSWFYILDENKNPISGISIAEVNKSSYPILVEDVKIKNGIFIDTCEITNFFCLTDENWTISFTHLIHAALSHLNRREVKKSIMFGSRAMRKFLKNKKNFNLKLIKERDNFDFDTALSNLKKEYGNSLNYNNESSYLKKNDPRAFIFDVKESLENLEKS